MFYPGYDADGNIIYYDTTSSKITQTPIYDDEENILTSSTLVINSLEDEMAYYGMTPEEIQNVMNKINGVSTLESNPKTITITDPTTGTQTTNPNGSLVSNSAQSLKNTTEFQKATIEIEKQKLQAMNTQNEIQKKQLDMMDYNLVMQGQIFFQLADLNANLKAQTTAISNQKLNATFQAGQTNVQIDTTAIAESTKTIADATVALSESAIVQKEHYDFLKNGSDTLKNSNGEKIIPQEVQAKINAEKLIEQEDTNKTTFEEIADLVGEALGVVEDGLEEALGNTDGFGLDFNPLSYIDEILMNDFIQNKDNYYPENKA